MGESRIDALRRMLDRRPGDPRVHFGLAAEYEREGRWEDVVRELREYLSLTRDEGNAWGRLAHALRELGRDGDAREALRAGIESALEYGHPTMAQEFEEALEALDKQSRGD